MEGTISGCGFLYDTVRNKAGLSFYDTPATF